jgi:hypothetical protein
MKDETKRWDSLVDAEIRSILVNPTRKEVRLELTNPGGDAKGTIVAIGVDDFVMHEMRLSNVIDRVRILAAADAASPCTASAVFFLLQGRLPESTELEWPALKERLDAIRAGSLTLMDIEPVYGARVLLLATSFELRPA